MSAPLFPDLVVNGEHVPQTAIAAEAQNHSAPSGKPGLAWRKAANALAVRTLLLQEARRRGLRASPEKVGEGRYEAPDEALIRELMETAISVEAPTEQEVRAEWERDSDRFRAPPLWEASHILVACDPADAKSRHSALARARGIARDCIARPGDFGRLAGEVSDCGSRASGGALGQLGPGDTLPEFEAALRRLGPGEITPEPVLTRHGWHVIKLDAAAPGAVLPYQAARDKIAEAMEKAAWVRAARAFIDSLIAAADISGATLVPRQVQSVPDSAHPAWPGPRTCRPPGDTRQTG